ncbi:acyltransferase family protein [Rhodoplanes sp. Z2-YC6860]|uniref:acyltransferase family protein n=1 Tax=Rhodoplanes sp. Z2-YC6860 TaxID=674703 RepID=UPI00078CCB41|nr:acyltransferase family protein [Rhodoplanes sp. Z2-YC6860]AMN38796.1 glucans biosynthesis protein C [Rhodoplanes sp. Z2-YC6860]
MRRTDIDGLRILICIGIILAHAFLIFAAEPRYHLKSAEVWPVASVAFEFFRVTTTPLFFTIAGWSSVVSLRRRSSGRYVLERVSRLLVPLIAGVLLFGSIIKYIELSHGRDVGFYGLRMVGDLHMSFSQFLPLSLTRTKLMTWSHLWFLVYLLPISLALLPLLIRLARSVPRTTVPAAFVVYLPALPLMALLVAIKGYWPFLPNLLADWNFFYYALLFAFGAGIAAWPGFETRLQSEARRLLVVGLLAFTGLILSGESQIGRLFVGLTAWSFIAAGLGLAARYKPTATPALNYLSEATMPVYIIHHAPLLLIGMAVLSLAIPVWLKVIVIWLATSAVSMAAYHWLIRPWPPIRFLMGMNVQAPRTIPAPQPQPNV